MKITRISLTVAFVVVFSACSADDFDSNRGQQPSSGSGSLDVTAQAGGVGGVAFQSDTSANGGNIENGAGTDGVAGTGVAGSGGNGGIIDEGSSGNSGINIIDGGVDGSGQQPGVDSGGQVVIDTGAPDTNTSNPETGRLVGMTAAHSAVRATVTTNGPLSPLIWSDTLAAYAQTWADTLALTCVPEHRSSSELALVGYGENIAAFGSSSGFTVSTAQQTVDGWASEASCWTYGLFMTTDSCNIACYTALQSDGCGHYTQIVWRNTAELGCGVSTCVSRGMNFDIWVCNYSPPGNVVMSYPY
jgi:pathogenesis-related protein 1